LIDKLNSLLTNGKAVFLALDQGLEHGPGDFNYKNINPEYVFDIAKKGEFNALILQKGLAIKYHDNYRYKIPLILKLNGKTSLPNNVEPYAPQLCSVNKAVKLGADAVGYTIYFGSPYETEMLKDFAKVEEEAHDYGLPVVVWAYPRGTGISDRDTDVLAYSARAALELGADFIKIKYNGDRNYNWVVKSAGNAKLFMSGGAKRDANGFLSDLYHVMRCGGSGIAVGRNVWQAANPLKVTKAIKSIVFDNKNVEKAFKFI
jgi:class I fructose-bisphosphate aldolase